MMERPSEGNFITVDHIWQETSFPGSWSTLWMQPTRIRVPAQASAWRRPYSMWSTLWCSRFSLSTYLWLWLLSPSRSKETRLWQSVAWRRMRWDKSVNYRFFYPRKQFPLQSAIKTHADYLCTHSGFCTCLSLASQTFPSLEIGGQADPLSLPGK